MNELKILVTNDDGYTYKGVSVLSKIMSKFGKVTVVAPKSHQSGMGMAVDLGVKQLLFKDFGETDGVRWTCLDATPASCAKFGLNVIYSGSKPDLLLSGVNHGCNVATGACYSGTLGCAQEGTLNGILSIGVSIDDYSDSPDFSAVEKFLPDIISKFLELPTKEKGVYYNINFPAVPVEQIKGVRVTSQGRGHWEKEFQKWTPELYREIGKTPSELGHKSFEELEEGEIPYVMKGEFIEEYNLPDSDYLLMNKGYITITPHNLYTTDLQEMKHLCLNNFEKDFK